MPRYNSDLPYDIDLPYDQGDVIVPVPVTRFDLNAIIPTIAVGVQIHVPVTHFHINGKTIEESQGAQVLVPVTNFLMSSGANFYKVQIVRFSGDPVPQPHVEDAQKLDADAYVDLFQIILSDRVTKLFLKMNKDTLWQGNTYEGTGIKIEGVGSYADDQVSRPKLTIFNPNGIYSYLVDQGLLDAATVVRYRVLKEHVTEDLAIYRRQQWKVSRIASLKNGFIGVELRDMLDGQNFLTPGRMYIPPDFPTVSLT